MRCLCETCRKRGCQDRAKMYRETFFSLGDGRVVECGDYTPTWQARLAA